VRDDPGLSGGIRGMPRCATQVSGRAHCVAARRAGLHHLDLATHPGAGMLDRLARPCVLGLSRLEEVEDVFRASRRPEGEEMVIRISEGSTAADRHEARVPDLREDHGWRSFLLVPVPRSRTRIRDHARLEAEPANPVVGPQARLRASWPPSARKVTAIAKPSARNSVGDSTRSATSS
jgi:hypothetical protein